MYLFITNIDCVFCFFFPLKIYYTSIVSFFFNEPIIGISNSFCGCCVQFMHF